MKDFFHPETVAVIGVSERPENLGRQIVANLQAFDFNGIFYPVGPRGGRLFGRRIYRSVSDIPDHIDLAVILTPAETTIELLKECGRKGIRRVIVESAGFGEFGDQGRVLQEQLCEVAAQFSIRFLGPNCIGIVNLHTGLAVPFTRMDSGIRQGGISIISQSGGVGISLFNVLDSEGLGLAKFASIGNKLDVNENDLLEYFISDPDTSIICMYLEGIHDGRRLMQLARQSPKPILLHKSNIGRLSAGIASSHTASLSADDEVVDAALRQAGIARFRDPETLVHYLKALPMPPLRGSRLAVLSRSGGHAVIAADECDLAGFELVQFPPSFLSEVESHLRAKVIRLTNPMDLGDLFDLDMYAKIAERTLAMEGVDGMVFLHTYMAQSEGEKSIELFHRIHQLASQYDKPVAIHAATQETEMSRLKRHLTDPIFTEPSDAVRSLALLRDFRHREVLPQVRPEGQADAESVRAVLGACREAGRNPLIQEAMDICRAYGIPVIEGHLVQSVEEAVEAATRIGFPVAAKVVSPEVSHKSDMGGVQLNLRSPEGVRLAYREMMDAISHKAPGARVQGVLLQPMVRGGRELIVGARWEANFGHVVLVGMGGIFVEVLRDKSLRVAPFDRRTAQSMVRELKVYPILEGIRGQEPSDRDALVDAILAVTRLVTDFSEITELDLNPIRVMPAKQGCVALDARMTIRPVAHGSTT